MNQDIQIDNVNEPAAVIPQIGYARDFASEAAQPGGAKKLAGFAEYQKDMEKRKARSLELQQKRLAANAPKEVNVVAELDAALQALEGGAREFEQTYLKPNLPLIESRNEVERLRSELAAAEAKLAEIEAKGDSVTRLQQSVINAEGALNGLGNAAEEQAMKKLIAAKFGWLGPRHKITPSTLKELALDISVQSLKEFAVMPCRNASNSVEELTQRLETVGRKLADLRNYLSEE